MNSLFLHDDKCSPERKGMFQKLIKKQNFQIQQEKETTQPDYSQETVCEPLAHRLDSLSRGGFFIWELRVPQGSTSVLRDRGGDHG
jgi:hypothetical protein